MVASAATAMVHIAPIQVMLEISSWLSGANTNCPRLPPALTNPEATDRLWAGTRCATTPISTPKLPAPAPAAVSTPMVMMSANSLVASGVSAEPTASISAPTSSTRYGAEAIGEGAEGGLRHAPHELADSHRETHGGVADMRAVDDGRDEQPQRLAHPHGDHEDGRRGRHEQQGAPIKSRVSDEMSFIAAIHP